MNSLEVSRGFIMVVVYHFNHAGWDEVILKGVGELSEQVALHNSSNEMRFTTNIKGRLCRNSGS